MLLIVSISAVFYASHHGWQFDAVLSGSMVPVLPVGGLVVVEPVNVNTLQVGDIISFKYQNMNTPVCHRIHAIEYIDGVKYFRTKGDANNAPEQFPVPLDAVYGKEVLHLPYVGRLMDIKNVGANRVNILGQSLPLAVPVVGGIGLLFIGITMRELIEYVFQPGKLWQKEVNKKRQRFMEKRRQAFKM